ncbi:MAG: carboxymuconolactone decarboxylase family protein [Gammaproteobacteria bacterium]
MTHIQPLSRESLPNFEPLFAAVEASMGFVPTSMLTMAHWPELLQAFAGLGGTVLGGGTIDPALKQLVAFVASNAAGCRYCQAHTSHSAVRAGVSNEKVRAAFEYETSELFSEAERAALRVAAHAGLAPNAVEESHMKALAEHFSEREIVEIVAVIALFGYLNRWNDTMATTLETAPKSFGFDTLQSQGWTPGKHG